MSLFRRDENPSKIISSEEFSDRIRQKNDQQFDSWKNYGMRRAFTMQQRDLKIVTSARDPNFSHLHFTTLLTYVTWKFGTDLN